MPLRRLLPLIPALLLLLALLSFARALHLRPVSAARCAAPVLDDERPLAGGAGP